MAKDPGAPPRVIRGDPGPPPPVVRPPTREEGLETDLTGYQPGIQYDPIQTLGVMGAGALAGGVPGAVVGGAGDIAFQIIYNQTHGLPWYFALPTEIAAMMAGSKAAQKFVGAVRSLGQPKARPAEVPPSPEVYRGPVTPKPAGESFPELPVVRQPRPSYFRPEEEYKAVSGTGVKGEWPNISLRPGERMGFEPVPDTRLSTITGQWPNLKSTVELPASPWARLRTPVEEVAQETLTTAKGKKIRTPKAEGVVPEVVPPPDTPPGSVWRDVKSFVSSASDLPGNWYRPILSTIERVAGPQIGGQLVALEGKTESVKGRLWQQLFGEVTDVLRQLPTKFYDNCIDAVEGKVAPATPQVANAIRVFNKTFGSEGSAVLAHAERGIHIDPLLNYFPREFEPSFVRGLINNPERQSKIAKQMVADGVALNPAEARQMIREFLSAPRRTLYKDRPSGAEFKRVARLSNYIRDPLQAVTMRGKAISRRLAEVEVYGAKRQNLRRLIQQVAPENQEQTIRLMRLTMGRDPVEEGLHRVASAAMSFQAVTSLSLSGIMNLSQPALLALRTSLPNMAKAMFTTAVHPMQSWAMARQLGIYSDMAQRQLMMELAGGKVGGIARNSLRLFNLTERFVRSVAAEAGADWAKTIQRRLVSASPQEVAGLRRELTRLNFTAPEVDRLLATKTLTPKDVELVKWSIADQVSFLPRPGRKSEFYLTNPMGPVILQFKSFLMNTGRLLKTTIADEWRAGNKTPFFRAVGVVLPTLAVMGEPLADINAAVRGTHRPVLDFSSPTAIAARAIDNVSQIGALGLGIGLIQEMTGLKPSRWRPDLASAIAGPTVGMLTKDAPPLAGALVNTLTGDTEEAARQWYETGRRALRRVPYAGPGFASYGFPPSAQGASESLDTVWDRLGLTQRVVERQRLRDINAQLRRLGG